MKKCLVKICTCAFLIGITVLAGTYINNAAVGGSAYDGGETVLADATPTDADTTGQVTVTTEATDTTVQTTEQTTAQTTNQTTANSTDNVTTEQTGSEEGSTEATTEKVVMIDTEEIKRIQDKQQEYKKDIEEAQELIDIFKDSQKPFIEQVEELDKVAVEYEKNLMALEEEKQRVEEYMKDTERQLQEAQEEIDREYELMKDHIRSAYEGGHYSVVDAILTSVTMVEILNRTEYIDQIREYDQQKMNGFIEKRDKLAQKQALQSLVFSAVDTINQEYSDEYEAIQILYEAKKGQIESYDKVINPLENQKNEIEKMYDDLDGRIAQLEAAATGGVYVGVDGKVIIPSIIGKGGFAWPMPSSTVITDYFGGREAPTAGASTYHRGIDIGCSSGSQVIAAADGSVCYTGYMGGGGITVMLDHGDGVFTVYHHLSAYSVKNGEKVKQGQVIAFSGNTGISTGPHLHFGVRVNGEYVDPLQFY